MKLKAIVFAATLALTGGLLAGCGGDNNSNPPTPPTPPGTASFTSFVKTQLKKPGNSTPAKVNGVDFKFPDRDNPDAYDDVLPPPSSNGG